LEFFSPPITARFDEGRDAKNSNRLIACGQVAFAIDL
jgi:hypothetical protein